MLVKRAQAGDQAAFEQILTESKARIHGLCSNFVDSNTGLEREVAFQIASEQVWRSIRSGCVDPNGDLYAQMSRPIRNKLITYTDYLRAEKRWQGAPLLDVDTLDEPGAPVIGSWADYRDPLRVVLAKEELRRCWALTTEVQRMAVARWLGGDTSQRTTAALGQLRRKVRPMLADPYGSHPTLDTTRRCRHCNGSLTGEDVRARVHRACKAAYRWQRELANRTAVCPAVPLRLV